MVQGLQRALPRPVARTSPERKTEPSQEHAPVPPGNPREEPAPSQTTTDPGDLNSPVGMEVSALESPATSGNAAEVVTPTGPPGSLRTLQGREWSQPTPTQGQRS